MLCYYCLTNIDRFLPHDAVYCKCGLCHHVVSIRLSVTFMNSVKMSKHIFEIFFNVW